MPLSTQPYKGARDFYPEDKRLQKHLFGIMRSVAERFGYEEYDAPILEPLDLYLAKTGEEIVSEQTYTFEDRGGRKVVIRPEMTPTVSRMVAARRQELAYPLRWYSIPNLWRYERPQRGRLREHWQLNIDVFGVSGLEAEHEVIVLASDIMQSIGAKRDMYTIRLNSRKLMNHFIREVLGLDETQAGMLVKVIDRRKKISQAEFAGQIEGILSPSQRETDASDQLFALLDIKSLDDLPNKISEHESVAELRRLEKLLNESGVTNTTYDPTLMRGFDYYTDIVFEVFDNNPDNNRSMFGGGRYDGLVGLFGVEPLPTVGFGMGDVTLANFIDAHDLMPSLRAETDIYVVMIGDHYEAVQPALADLREMGVNVALDTSGRKPYKQIQAAEKKGVHYVLFIGDEELKSEQYTLKNLLTGEEEKHALQRIVTIVKDYRKQ